MDRPAADPLTPAEAKARLLGAAEGAGLEPWTREHPFEGVFLAFLFGLLAGLSSDARRTMRQILLLLARGL